MGKSYDICPKAVADRGAAILKKFHPDLAKVKVAIEYLFISHDGEGPALKLHGYACAAVVRIIPLKDRVAGRGDAEIVIDRDGWDNLPDASKDALLDHELTHLVLQKDRNRKPKADDAGRPALKMRLHDQQLGWFDDVARRHGEASMEIRCARDLIAKRGQLYFQFGGDAPAAPEAAADDGKVVDITKPIPSRPRATAAK